MRAGAHQGGDRQVQRRLAAGHGNRADTAFQRRHALFEHRIGRVADPAVNMAGALQVEEGSGVIARFEDERGRQVDGRGACAGGGVGARACVQGQRVKAGV